MVENRAASSESRKEDWIEVLKRQRDNLSDLFAREEFKTKDEYKRGLPEVSKFIEEWDGKGTLLMIDPRFNLGAVLERTETVGNIDIATTQDVVSVPSSPYIAQIGLNEIRGSLEDVRQRTGTGATVLEGIMMRCFFGSISVGRKNFLFGSRTDGIYIPYVVRNGDGKNEIGIQLPIGGDKQNIASITVLKRHVFS